MSTVSAADVRRAADQLPMTLDNLKALCSMVEQFAFAIYQDAYINADVVHDHLVNAFEACDDVRPITHADRSDWANAQAIEHRRAA